MAAGPVTGLLTNLRPRALASQAPFVVRYNEEMRDTFTVCKMWTVCLLIGLLACVAYDVIRAIEVPLCLEPLTPLLLE